MLSTQLISLIFVTSLASRQVNLGLGFDPNVCWVVCLRKGKEGPGAHDRREGTGLCQGCCGGSGNWNRVSLQWEEHRSGEGKEEA